MYGYRDADWSWSPSPDATVAGTYGRDPGSASDNDPASRRSDHTSVWDASAGADLPSNHAAQINRLIDDLLAGRPHDTTLASTRPTMEFVTALYMSAIEGDTVHRSDLTADHGFYRRLDGGLSADLVSSRLSTDSQLGGSSSTSRRKPRADKNADSDSR